MNGRSRTREHYRVHQASRDEGQQAGNNERAVEHVESLATMPRTASAAGGRRETINTDNRHRHENVDGRNTRSRTRRQAMTSCPTSRANRDRPRQHR